MDGERTYGSWTSTADSENGGKGLDPRVGGPCQAIRNFQGQRAEGPAAD